MRRNYSCPHCHGILNPNIKIILRADHESHRGLMLFSPQPGNYDCIIPEGFKLKKKSMVRFLCPLCGKDLTSRRDRTMAEIHYATSAGHEGMVVFSRIYGHHATYFITDEEVKSYGEHIDEDTVNFWGLGHGDGGR
jgi:predicted RNA-binding Zn-ribbon protein involved in translation (DUF1610 family)